MTSRQAADLLACSKELVCSLARKGELASWKVGRENRFDLAAVEMYRAGGRPGLTAPATGETTTTPDLLTLKEAEARTGLSPATLASLVETGRLAARRAGGMLVFEPDAVDAVTRHAPPTRRAA